MVINMGDEEQKEKPITKPEKTEVEPLVAKPGGQAEGTRLIAKMAKEEKEE